MSKNNKLVGKYTKVEINDDSRGTYNTNNQIKIKTSMLKTTFCDYSDTYLLVKGYIYQSQQKQKKIQIMLTKCSF